MKIKHASQEYLPEIEVRKYTQKAIRSYRKLFVRYLDEEADVFDTEDLTLASVRKLSVYMVVRGKKGRNVNGLLKQRSPSSGIAMTKDTAASIPKRISSGTESSS